MNNKKRFFIISMPIIMAICSLFLICNYADAATRTTVRTTPASRKSISVKKTVQPTQQNQQQTVEPQQSVKEEEPDPTPEPIIVENDIVDESAIIINKSDQFDDIVSQMLETATPDNSFAEMIRRQRAALEASESATLIKSSMKSGKNTCDSALRKCMQQTCGNDFTKCALDGDTIFGDKLNRCRHDTECSGEEFKLFTAEIKADRDMNVKLYSYNAVINCGSAYNACLMNECGSNFDACLGKANADAAIQKCSVIARDCMEYDSGLASRFGSSIAKLRENAEKEIKKDEEKLYKLREKIANQCTSMGAMFDERTFDCVYTVNFYTGENRTLTASRKRYAGDTFICTQEWFGVNATTYKENAYRETRAQTAATSAMMGAGLGTVAGLAASGQYQRNWDVYDAKKAFTAEEKKLKEDCEKNTGIWKDGECTDMKNPNDNTEKKSDNKNSSTSQQNNPAPQSLDYLTNPETLVTLSDEEKDVANKRSNEYLAKLNELSGNLCAEKYECIEDIDKITENLNYNKMPSGNKNLTAPAVINKYAEITGLNCTVERASVFDSENKDFKFVPCNRSGKKPILFTFSNTSDKPITNLLCLMYQNVGVTVRNNTTICTRIDIDDCTEIEVNFDEYIPVIYDSDANTCAIGTSLEIAPITTNDNIKLPSEKELKQRTNQNKKAIQKTAKKTDKKTVKKQEESKPSTNEPTPSYVENITLDREDIKLNNNK